MISLFTNILVNILKIVLFLHQLIDRLHKVEYLCLEHARIVTICKFEIEAVLNEFLHSHEQLGVQFELLRILIEVFLSLSLELFKSLVEEFSDFLLPLQESWDIRLYYFFLL